MSESLNPVHDWLADKEKAQTRLSVNPETSRAWKPVHMLRAAIYKQLQDAVNGSAVLTNAQRRTVEAAVERASVERENESDQTAVVLLIATYINTCQ